MSLGESFTSAPHLLFSPMSYSLWSSTARIESKPDCCVLSVLAQITSPSARLFSHGTPFSYSHITTAPSRSFDLDRAFELHRKRFCQRFQNFFVYGLQHQIFALADVTLNLHSAPGPQSWSTLSEVFGQHPPALMSRQERPLRLEPMPKNLPPHLGVSEVCFAHDGHLLESPLMVTGLSYTGGFRITSLVPSLFWSFPNKWIPHWAHLEITRPTYLAVVRKQPLPFPDECPHCHELPLYASGTMPVFAKEDVSLDLAFRSLKRRFTWGPSSSATAGLEAGWAATTATVVARRKKVNAQERRRGVVGTAMSPKLKCRRPSEGGTGVMGGEGGSEGTGGERATTQSSLRWPGKKRPGCRRVVVRLPGRWRMTTNQAGGPLFMLCSPFSGVVTPRVFGALGIRLPPRNGWSTLHEGTSPRRRRRRRPRRR